MGDGDGDMGWSSRTDEAIELFIECRAKGYGFWGGEAESQEREKRRRDEGRKASEGHMVPTTHTTNRSIVYRLTGIAII